jgi:para-nitrobenzyl esterase
LIGTVRDEGTFFMAKGDSAGFELTESQLKERLAKIFGSDATADAMLAAYRHSRPEASPTDLYIVIGTAAGFGTDSIRLAERKAQQQGAPVYMYLFNRGSEQVANGTQHKLGAYHSFDRIFTFDNLGLLAAPRTPLEKKVAERVGLNPGSFAVARHVSEMWTFFARTAIPPQRDSPRGRPTRSTAARPWKSM